VSQDWRRNYPASAPYPLSWKLEASTNVRMDACAETEAEAEAGTALATEAVASKVPAARVTTAS
jgi:hypothetical protein